MWCAIYIHKNWQLKPKRRQRLLANFLICDMCLASDPSLTRHISEVRLCMLWLWGSCRSHATNTDWAFREHQNIKSITVYFQFSCHSSWSSCRLLQGFGNGSFFKIYITCFAKGRKLWLNSLITTSQWLSTTALFRTGQAAREQYS